MSDHPPWTPFRRPEYARVMRARCNVLLREIISDEDRRRVVLTDPQAVHAGLFSGLTPDGYSEYAGTYRGTPGTTLFARECMAPSVLRRGTDFKFLHSTNVTRQMDDLVGFVAHVLENPPSSAEDKLANAAKVFGLFGCIHPFLDGNGHVQRALFAAMVTEWGIPLSTRFVIHPRPYDILLMTMLEMFTHSRGGDDDISRVSEYLRYFLGGPFEGPYEEFDE